jgi:Tfp pilus assembly ATPase PilU
MVLVTGPTGSGKITTLAAMIDHVNTTSAGKIVTDMIPSRSSTPVVSLSKLGPL